MDEIRIVGPGKTRGYPYPVCKKEFSSTAKNWNKLCSTSKNELFIRLTVRVFGNGFQYMCVCFVSIWFWGWHVRFHCINS